ncbi:DNA alkylation repair protein [Paramuribaculum intestinale]|uniref:DNA alkylation repair protein n=1 Tax=Paramuribaculum intestinale TaxID=2094151 RepID=UPI0025A9CC25|nr:DNA alkylation repair protein [Paramuribaculum intestinale]
MMKQSSHTAGNRGRQRVTADEIIATMEDMTDEKQREVLCRFFKTAPGQYGEGDKFLGIRVPATRMIVKEARLCVAPDQIARLLASPWHEIRLAGFLLLAEEMSAALPRRGADTPSLAAKREEIARFYLAHASRANNWDLVDLSAPYIIGRWLLYPDADGKLPDRGILDTLASHSDLWHQRIGIVATLALIRQGQTADTLRIATRLLDHRHDLIHKATGWMLREVGKKDPGCLLEYLESHFIDMPRTALRYAIERLPEPQRLYWLKRQ